MAIFKGSSGIDQLRNKVKTKVHKAISDGVNYSTSYITQVSPYGDNEYAGGIYTKEDVGQFKNSWFATTDKGMKYQRSGDISGSDSIDSANTFFANYKFQETIYIINGALHAQYVEEGWFVKDFPERENFSEPDKDGYHIVSTRKSVITEILKNSVTDNKGD